VFGKIRIRTGAVQLRHADPPQLTTTHNKKRKSRHPKHANLQRLNFDRCLGKPTRLPFTCAVPDGFNHSVLEKAGHAADTPHHTYVDDDIYAEVWDRTRIEQAVAASIEAIFLLLGYSDLTKWQDPISFDKMIEMFVAPINRVLGHIIDTRRMTVGTPPEFLAEILQFSRQPGASTAVASSSVRQKYLLVNSVMPVLPPLGYGT
jgi:hypothetical protein